MPEFQDTLLFWHDRLGHPGCDIMLSILKSSHMHKLYPYVGLPPCKACSLGKLNTHPSHIKIIHDPLKFLQRIQWDICGPIQPTCGPFRYFMVLVDASTRWTHVFLLSTRNAAFAKLLAQIIKLRAHHLDYPIKSIRLDNAGEFMSQTFDDYCMSVGIDVEHLVPPCSHPKQLGKSFHKAPSIDRSDFGYKNQTAGICLWLCNIARNYVGRPEAHHYPTTFTVTFGHWIRA
ncbi:hypothetical protein ACFX2C_038430 [Malus domestica]